MVSAATTESVVTAVRRRPHRTSPLRQATTPRRVPATASRAMWKGYWPPRTGPITPAFGMTGKYAPNMMVAVRKAKREAIAAATMLRICLSLPGGVVAGGVDGRRLVNMVVFLGVRGIGGGSGLRSHHEAG